MKLAKYRSHSPILNIPHFSVRFIPCRHERYPPAGSLLFSKNLPHSPSHTRETLVSHSIHPECALLEYHHNTLNAVCNPPATPDTPSPHLGSSKAPCYACRIFFSAYQSLYTQKHHHKLAHHYVYIRLSPVSDDRAVHPGFWLPPHLDGVGEDVEAKFLVRRAHRMEKPFELSPDL